METIYKSIDTGYKLEPFKMLYIPATITRFKTVEESRVLSGNTIYFDASHVFSPRDVITFLFKNEYVFFRVIEVEVSRDKPLSIVATQIGYNPTSFDYVDIRPVLDAKIYAVVDEDVLTKLAREGTYC